MSETIPPQPDPPEQISPFPSRPLVIAVVALAVRLYIQILSPVIAADSAVYLNTALLMREGKFVEGLDYRGLHPLFPMATALTGFLLPRLEEAATLVALLASSAVVWPLFTLFSITWSRRKAVAACLVYALHPVLAPYTSEALPTSLFLFFFISALACGLRALRGGRWFHYPLGGAFAALAYLSRTEGLAAGLFLAVAAGISLLRRVPPSPRGRILLGTAAAVIAGAALTGPYVAHLSRKAGRFTITDKGGGTVLLQAAKGEDVAAPTTGVTFPFFKTLSRTFLQAFFPPLLVFLAAGFWLERKETRRHLGLLALGIAALAPPILVFALNRYFRTSPRYFFAGETLLLPWLASPMVALVDLARRRWPSSRLAAPATAGLLVLLLVGKYLLPHRQEEWAYRNGGDWLAAHPPADRPWTLVSSSEKLSWYSGAVHVTFDVPRENAAPATTTLCRASRADLLSIDSEGIADLGGQSFLDSLERAGFKRVETFRSKGRDRELIVWIYRSPPL